MQQAKKWLSDSTSGWRVRHMLKQFDEMVSSFISFYENVNLNITFKAALCNRVLHNKI